MNFTQIKHNAESHRKSPRQETWSKLNDKLNVKTKENEKREKTIIFRYAATVLVLLASSFFFLNNQYLKNSGKPLFELTSEPAYIPEIYTPDNITSLKFAYSKVHLQPKPVQVDL
jgi:hypothetical protein